MTLTSSFQKIAETLLGNSGYGNVYIRTYARVSSSGPDIENNRPLIYVQARIYTEGGYWHSSSGTTYRITASGSLDSGTVSCNGQYEVGETVLGTISGYVNHNDDGTRTIHAESNFTSTPWGWNATASASNISLPTIPRASTVSCSSPYIGDTAIITVGKKVASFTSTVTYKIGTLTGTIAEKTTETVLSLETEALKEQIYALIPNAKSTSGTITCTTYSGNTQIGSPTTATFNLYAVEEDCKPIVRGIVVDTNPDTKNLTGGEGYIIVKNASKPKVTVTAEPQLSSTIKSYSINLNDGQTASGQEYTFDTINSNKITVSATDSRGYPNSYDIDLTDRIVDYVKLYFNSVKLSRPEGTSNEVILDCDGVWFNGNFKADTLNTLKVSFQYRLSGETEWIDGGEITPTIDGNKFSFNNYSLGDLFDYNSEYQFKIIATDLLMTVGDSNKESIPVPKGQEVWYECEDGIGVYGHIWKNDIEMPIAHNELKVSSIDTYACDYINSLQPNIITDGEPVKTGRKIDGKDEYVKRVNTGALPNATIKKVSHGLDMGSIQVTDLKGMARRYSVCITLPYVATNANWQVELLISSGDICITAGDDKSSYTSSYVDIYFTYN